MSGRVRKPPGGGGGGNETFEWLGGIRYEPEVMEGAGTTGGIVGDRLAVGFGLDGLEVLRESPVVERDGLTEAVCKRAPRVAAP